MLGRVTDIEAANRKRGWQVVAICFIAMAFTFGARSSVSMVLPIWRSELGWDATQISSGAAIILTIMAIGSPIAGKLMDRFGARAVITTGLVALSFGIGATSYVSVAFHYQILFGVIGGIGWACVSIPLVTAAVSGYFERSRGLAIGIAVSGATGGQLPVLTLIGGLIVSLGWRNSYQILSVVILALAVLVWLRFRPPLRAGSDTAAAGSAGPGYALGSQVKALFTNWTFLMLLGAFSLCGFTTAGVVDIYFIPYAELCGFTKFEGTAAYGIHGLGNLAGVILFSWMADHVNRPRLLATMFFLRALSFVLLLYIAIDIRLMFAFAAIFGILNFATFPVIANIVATHIGLRGIGLTLGLLFGGHSLGAAIGGQFGGWVLYSTRNLDLVWLVSVGLAALAGVFAIFIRENRDPPGRAVPTPA